MGPTTGPSGAAAETPPVRRRRAAPALRSGLPPLGERATTVLAGVVAGAALLLGGMGSRTVCGATAGGCRGLGLPLALAVGALAILLGWVVLRAFRMDSPGTITVLGGACLAVVAMLLPAGLYEARWTAVLFPVIGATAYLLAWRLTTSHLDGPGPTTRD